MLLLTRANIFSHRSPKSSASSTPTSPNSSSSTKAPRLCAQRSPRRKRSVALSAECTANTVDIAAELPVAPVEVLQRTFIECLWDGGKCRGLSLALVVRGLVWFVRFSLISVSVFSYEMWCKSVLVFAGTGGSGLLICICWEVKMSTSSPWNSEIS